MYIFRSHLYTHFGQFLYLVNRRLNATPDGEQQIFVGMEAIASIYTMRVIIVFEPSQYLTQDAEPT